MNFIGVIGKDSLNSNTIRINERNIENLKNIKFQIIIINSDLSKFENLLEEVGIIIRNSEYVIINSDLDIKVDISDSIRKKIITCGLNQKSTVTVSSITEERVLIDLQREIETIDNKIIEPEEKMATNYGNTDIHDILLNYAVETILKK